MRAHRLGAAMLCFGFALATGSALAAEPVSAGECFLAGMKANDADAVAACYADDAIIWFPGGSMAKGRAAIRDGFAHYMATMTVKPDTSTERPEVAAAIRSAVSLSRPSARSSRSRRR